MSARVHYCLFTNCFGPLHVHGINDLDKRAAGKQCPLHFKVHANGNKNGCRLSEIRLDTKNIASATDDYFVWGGKELQIQSTS